jgi:outer membrane lipoprotein SlyB
VAILALGAAPVLAQSDSDAVVGGTAGGVSGAVAGGLIFGPIGAIIGGFTGAVIGASVVSEASVEYARANPTEPVVIEGDIEAGFVVPADIELHVVESDPEYGYFYTNDRVWFVQLSDRTVVYSPGTVVAVE